MDDTARDTTICQIAGTYSISVNEIHKWGLLQYSPSHEGDTLWSSKL
jgi:hypothetical protein